MADNKVKKVAIIGGGISGLSLAYKLLTQEYGYKFEITVYENSSRLGGNAHTLPINLNENSNDPNYIRWADMGVNDFNMASYPKTVELMQQVGYIENPDEYYANYALEDSCAYGSLDGSVIYTDDGQFQTSASESLQAEIKRFKIEAPNDVSDRKYSYYSVERYAREKKYSDDFIYNNLYARINGMYFCNGAPGEMPFVGVMHYYILQEGFNAKTTPQPKRCYFKGGSSSWIDALKEQLIKLGGKDIIKFITPSDDSSFAIETGCFKDDSPTLRIAAGCVVKHIKYDNIVIATHADDAIHLFDDQSKVPRELIRILASFNYAPATSVCHSDARVFQPNHNSWRTYNIHVYDFKNDVSGPYTINYIENRHQNDIKNKTNPAYNSCEYPKMFVSLNPTSFPHENTIFNSSGIGNKAVAKFKHQKLTLESLMAQQDLAEIQGQYGLYYCNGFALGAGLHEECILLAEHIMQRLCDIETPENMHYDPFAPIAVPDYMTKAIFAE